MDRPRPRVFISHTTADDAAIRDFAQQLISRGLDPWIDDWEVLAGDDIVERMNDGLAQCDAGIVVFSKHTVGKKWMAEEWRTLFYDRVEDGKRLIPVLIDDDAVIPHFMRRLSRRYIHEVDAIAEALLG